MKEIINLISKLIENGHAYIAENGDVYYDVESFKDYGKLSGQNLEDLSMGAGFDARKKSASMQRKSRRIRWTLRFGRQKKRGNPIGKARFLKGDQDGISNAPQ